MIYEYVPFRVITDYEIENNAVNLSDYRYIVNLAGTYGMSLLPAKVQRAVDAWIASGGQLLQISQDGMFYVKNQSKASSYVWPYPISGTFSWPGNLDFSGPEASIGKIRIGGALLQSLSLNGPGGSSAESQEIPVFQPTVYTVNLYVAASKSSEAKISAGFILANGGIESPSPHSVVTGNHTWVWLRLAPLSGGRLHAPRPSKAWQHPDWLRRHQYLHIIKKRAASSLMGILWVVRATFAHS